MESSADAVAVWVLGVAVLTCGLGFMCWVWLRPKKLERCVRQQGFSGNSYQLFFGSSKENTIMSEQQRKHMTTVASRLIPYYEPRPREQSSSYQRTAKASYMDKLTGNYIRTAAKEVISAGETFKERGSAGRVGTKNEYTTAKSLRVGDKWGYFEYEVQEKFRRVDFYGDDNSSSNKGSHSSGGLCLPFQWRV